MSIRHVLVGLLWLAACDDTTGVQLRIHDATPADQVSVTAATALGPVSHALAPPAGPNWTLTLIATFRPDIGNVSFSAQPFAAGVPVGSCASRDVAVSPHHVVNADIACGASSDAGVVGSDYFATVLADHPLAYYHLGEASGNALDATGNHQDGTYGAQVARHQVSPLANARAVADGAAGFAGGVATAVLTVQAAASFLPKVAISVELWLNATTPTQNAVLLQYDFNSGKVVPVYSLSLQQDHVVFFVHAAGGSALSSVTSASTIAANTVYHVIGSYDQGTQVMSLWLNGALDATASGNNGDIIHGDPTTSGIGIGGSHNDAGTEAFAGILDEAAIYGFALTQDRVSAHYASGQQP
jgi:hypothetical protein